MCDFASISTFMLACSPLLSPVIVERSTTVRDSNIKKNAGSIPKSDLFDSIRMRCWSKALSILTDESQYHHAAYVNKHGYTSLHFACLRHDTPLRLIKTLLKASPKCALLQDKRGQTPLSIALENASDDAIITLIEACPEAVSMLDGSGRTPLRIAIQAEKPTKVIQLMLRANPSLLDKHSMDLFFGRWNMGLREILESSKGSRIPPEKLLNMDVPHYLAPRKVSEIYEKARLLIEASSKNKSHLVHSSILLQSCPWSFTELLLRIHPEQAWQEDGNGKLPLHVAVECKSSSFDGSLYRCSECRSQFEDKWYQHRNDDGMCTRFCKSCISQGLDCWGLNKDDLKLIRSVDKISATISSLVEKCPMSAEVVIDGNKLPLHLAIENGLDFECTRPIFNASIKSFYTKNPNDHLTASMIAATSKSDEKLKQFSACYAWLLEDPMIVMNR